MKFLCLHGACTNPETMRWSLSRLLKQFPDDENITFHFAQGYLDSQPPHWLAEQLEGPPHLRFFQWNSSLLDFGYKTHVQKHGLPSLKEGMWGIDVEPEQLEDDKLGPLFAEYMNNPPEPWSVGVALEYLHNIIEDEGPFHGVIGISEGASVASTLLVEDIQHCQAMGIRSNFQCGLFYIGAPAWSADGTKVVLSDEYGQVINIPTCHLIGTKDIFKVGADQLLKICNADKALVIHDSGGHRMPQDMPTNEKIADWIREQERELTSEAAGTGSPSVQ